MSAIGPRILALEQIKSILAGIDVVPAIEEGFVRYSKGDVVVPPVGELMFDRPRGDVHIKYGYIRNDDVYVIKIASSFYENPKLGLSSSDGSMLVYCQETGELDSILLDQGYLTNVRTAAAGAVAAKYLAPREVRQIGVFGAGIQGRMQLEYLRSVVECRKVIVWGLNDDELAAYREEMTAKGFRVRTTLDAAEAAKGSNLIVTATPAQQPILLDQMVEPGTHVTAMGSDTPEKQELDAAILGRADRVVADSISQSKERGEIFQACRARVLSASKAVELGTVIQTPSLQRANDEETTVVDLTGVAVQDIQIAKAVCKASRQGG